MSCSASFTPVPIARSATKNWSRGRSASTARTAPARRATAWDSRVAFDPDLIAPRPELSLGEGAIAPWKDVSPAVMRRLKSFLRPWMAAAGVNWSTPLASLKPKTLEQLLRGDGKDFPGVLVLLEKEYATTSSEARRRGLEAFRGEVVCAGVQGGPAAARGPRGALRGAGDPRNDGSDRRRRETTLRLVLAHPAAGADRPADPAGTHRPARFLGQCRPGVPHSRSRRGHAQRRRIAARPPGQRPRLRPRRRLLRARRAVDRTPPARQSPPDRRPAQPAIAGQHGRRRRARRDDHARGRLAGGPRPGGGPTRRLRRRPGNSRRSGRGRLPDGPMALRPPADGGSPGAAASPPRGRSPSKARR